MSASYRPDEAVGGLEAELARLEAQAALSWPEEARLLTWLGLPAAHTVLDLGCGPGYVTERLLDLAPTAALTALDQDAVLLERARRRLAGAPAHRLRFVDASALATGLPESSFDFVLARFLFQHLPQTDAVAGEARRVLRPGGTFAVSDVDGGLYGIVQPQTPELAEIFAKAGRLQSQRGGNRLIGRQLWRILTAAGFSDVHLDAYVYHSDVHGVAAFDPHLSPTRLRPAVEAGLITEHEYAAVRQAYRRFLEAPGAYVLLVGLIASGRKPTATEM